MNGKLVKSLKTLGWQETFCLLCKTKRMLPLFKTSWWDIPIWQTTVTHELFQQKIMLMNQKCWTFSWVFIPNLIFDNVLIIFFMERARYFWKKKWNSVTWRGIFLQIFWYLSSERLNLPPFSTVTAKASEFSAELFLRLSSSSYIKCWDIQRGRAFWNRLRCKLVRSICVKKNVHSWQRSSGFE